MSKSNKFKTNNSKKNTVNKARNKSKISKIINDGREEITEKSQLEKFKKGSLISFSSISDKFRIGGFIVGFCDDSFIYVTPDFKKKYRVKYRKIVKIWVGDVYKVKNDIISFVPSSQFPTKWEVKINDIVIYYAASKYDADRFKNTDKYMKLLQWNDYFNDTN